MESIKISVVVPTYNRPSLLHTCLRQLVSQSIDKKYYEVIVVSDGPDQESRKVVEGYKNEKKTSVRYLSLRTKLGPAAARNLGWRNAVAPLIAFTDDDCVPESNWLQVILSQYNGAKEIAFSGKVIVPISATPTDFELNTKGLETGDFVTANCVVTKQSLHAIGGIDERFTAAWREDSDLEFNLIERGVPIVKLEEAIVIHPVRKAFWGVSLREQKKSRFNALLFKKYPALYRQRIKKRPAWRYYLIVLFFALFLISVVLDFRWLWLLSLTTWLSLTVGFILKRLSNTSKAMRHVVEMIVTSFAIPFLSVYWTIYGAIKYRVLFF